MATNLDLSRIYGLGSCPMGGCGAEGMDSSSMPSLEQIAPNNMTNQTMQGTNMGNTASNSQDGSVSSNGQTSQNMNFPNAQPATNGVSNSLPIPMTQEQINAENPDMLTAIQGYSQPFPVTAESIQYLNSLMRTQIGRRVTVQLLIGSGTLIDRSGYLLAVGANFILLNEIGTRNVMSCDFYAIKFVTFYY